VELHKYSAKNKSIELKSRFLKPLPEKVIGDPFRLQQVLNNLIGNAIKFTDKGGVTITVKKVSEGKGKCDIQFSINDTGIGIAENKMHLLFKSFSQVENFQTRKFGGTGLGLAISKELIDMMNGKIWVESKQFVGSTFSFTINFNLPKSETEYNINSDEQIDFPSRILKILVVEDSLINQEVIKQVLLSKNCDIVITSSGQEAIEASQSNTFDIILMDVQLPDIDGIEVTKIIRENDANLNQNTPVIALTGHASEEHKKECLNSGFNSFITKPYSWDYLFIEINRLTTSNSKSNINGNNRNNNGNNTNSVINLDKLLIALNGNKTVLKHLIEYYNKNYIEEINEIKQAFLSADFEKIEHLAHRIKSEVGNFEAMNAIDIARNIEQKSKEGDKKTVEELIPDLENELILIAKELSGIKID